MRRWTAAAAIAVAPALHAQGPADLSTYGWFAELAGACWRGEHADGRTSDTQCYELQYGRLVRGTIKVEVAREGNAAIAFQGDSVFAAEPAANRVVYSQWGSNGSYNTGVMVVEGTALVFRNRARDGSEARVRFVWTRVDADNYRVAREREEDGLWKPELTVVYRRLR